MPKKTIAIIVALAAIVVLLLVGTSNKSWKGPAGPDTFLSNLHFPSFGNLPNAGDTFTVTAAWSTFQDYLKFAKNHDIEGVKSLSYQLSEVCANPATRADCETRMDSVYAIAHGFRLEDFKNVFYDEKQIILATDYMDLGAGADPIKVVLYFVKDDKSQPKVLGIRFCFGTEDANHTCVITDPAKRDADNDGWWDDIEEFFNR